MCDWLRSLLPWGTEVLVTIQAHSNELIVAIFTLFTFLGEEEFYLLALPLVLWSIDKEIGSGLASASLLSVWTNGALKYICAIPRPSDPRLVIHRLETSPAFPSGHAQNAMVNWGYVAARFRNRILWVVAVIAIIGIGLSRLVLAVHYPQDVIGGWLIGLLLLLVFLWVEPRLRPWLAAQRVSLRLALAVAVPLGLIFLHPADTEGLYPAPGAVTPMGALAGFWLGSIMDGTWLHFQVEGPWRQRILRLLLGLVIVGIVYAGPKLLIPDDLAPALGAALRFARYTLVGWAAAFACPWLFVKLGLATQSVEEAKR